MILCSLSFIFSSLVFHCPLCSIVDEDMESLLAHVVGTHHPDWRDCHKGKYKRDY